MFQKLNAIHKIYKTVKNTKPEEIKYGSEERGGATSLYDNSVVFMTPNIEIEKMDNNWFFAGSNHKIIFENQTYNIKRSSIILLPFFMMIYKKLDSKYNKSRALEMAIDVLENPNSKCSTNIKKAKNNPAGIKDINGFTLDYNLTASLGDLTKLSVELKDWHGINMGVVGDAMTVNFVYNGKELNFRKSFKNILHEYIRVNIIKDIDFGEYIIQKIH